ncbi:hypothetical protein MPER_01312, partial [Moniliophthora perniciosa FA553]
LGLAILQDPEHNIVSAYANNGGSASPAYNSGLMFYYAYWAVVIFIFLITSLRTNLVFAAPSFVLIRVAHAFTAQVDILYSYIRIYLAHGCLFSIGGWKYGYGDEA